MPRDTFGQAARIHENKRGVVLANELRQAIVNFIPDFARHHRFQRRLRQLDRDVELARVAAVDNRAVGNVVGVDVCCANEKPRYFFNWPLCG